MRWRTVGRCVDQLRLIDHQCCGHIIHQRKIKLAAKLYQQEMQHIIKETAWRECTPVTQHYLLYIDIYFFNLKDVDSPL